MRAFDFMISSGIADEFAGRIPSVRAVPMPELYDDPPVKQIGHEHNTKFDATLLTQHWKAPHE